MKGYHERMKEYYDRRAPEYDGSLPGEPAPGLGERAARPEVIEDRPDILRAYPRGCRRSGFSLPGGGSRWPLLAPEKLCARIRVFEH